MTSNALPMAQHPTNPALAALKDIQLPEPNGWWPLAPGYWLVLALIIILLLGLFFYLKHRRRKLASRNLAMIQLEKLALSDAQFAAKVNTLLKRAALSHLPRTQIAALDGKQWYQFMDAAMPKKHQHKFAPLLEQRFSGKPISAQDAENLKMLAEIWLKQALPSNKALNQALLKEALC